MRILGRMKRRTWFRKLLALMVLGYAFLWVDFALAKTPLPVPVDGVKPGGVPDGFRGPIHEGVDIFAARGTAVRSVTAGMVVRVETQHRGGNVVFVLGDDAVLYFYAHLQDWAPGLHEGQLVTTGDLLGHVGDTGNAKGRSPHLHFEARPAATAFAPVDPKLLIGPKTASPEARILAAIREVGDPR